MVKFIVELAKYTQKPVPMQAGKEKKWGGGGKFGQGKFGNRGAPAEDKKVGGQQNQKDGKYSGQGNFLTGPKQNISDIAISNDAKILVASSWDPEHSLIVWRRDKIGSSFQPVGTYVEEKDVILRVAIWDSNKVYIGTACGNIKCAHINQRDIQVDAVPVCHDTGMIVGLKKVKEFLVSASSNGSVCIWKLPTDTTKASATKTTTMSTLHPKDIFYMKYKNEKGEEQNHGKIVALGASRRNIAVCTVKGHTWISRMKSKDGQFTTEEDHQNYTCLALNDKQIWSGTLEGVLKSTEGGKSQKYSVGEGSGPIYCISIARDVQKAVVGCGNAGLLLFDFESRKFDNFASESSPVVACATTDNGNCVVWVTGKAWDIESFDKPIDGIQIKWKDAVQNAEAKPAARSPFARRT